MEQQRWREDKPRFAKSRLRSSRFLRYENPMFPTLRVSLGLFAILALSNCGKAPPAVSVRVNDENLQVVLFAGEPLIQHPIGITIDSEGRLLAIESHTHHRPENWKGPVHDQIVWLKDVDGDGQADTREVIFAETDATMGIAAAPDGSIFVSTRDEILRLSDQGEDGKPRRVERKIVWLDTENHYPHNELSSLAFDASGGLYFGVGENYGVAYKLIGSDGKSVSDQGEGGNVWHVTREGKDLRRVATGFWNPFGLCVDAWGNVFATDNDPNSRPPCRLLHVVEGGNFGYEHRYGRSGLHPFVSWNGELPGTLPMVAATGEAPCSVLMYQPPATNGGRGLGARWHGSLLIAAWGENRIESYRVHPKDGTFVGDRVLLCEGGEDFRPVDMVTAADGSVYVSDWAKRDYELHGRGRIWRISAKVEAVAKASDLPPLPEDPQATLREQIRNGPVPSEIEILERLASPRPYVSAAAIERLSREPAMMNRLLARQSELAANVHSKVLIALRAATFPEPGAGSAVLATPVEPVLKIALNSQDPEVKLVALKWISDKRLNGLKSDVEGVLNDSEISAGIYFSAITTVARLESEELDEATLVDRLKRDIADPQTPTKRKCQALKILPDRNRNMTRAEVAPILDGATGEERAWLVHFLGTLWEPQKTGVMNSLSRLWSKDAKASTAERLHQMAMDPAENAVARSAALLQSEIADSEVGQLVELATSKESKHEVKMAALQALQGKTISKSEAEALRKIDAPTLTPMVARVLGESFFPAKRPDVKDTRAWSAYLEQVEGSADISNGRNVFMSARLGNCAGCHRADGIGQQAGPNLSSIFQTAAPDYALESLLQPSRNVAPQFESFMVVTRDGQTRMGFEIDERGGQITYVSISGQTFRVTLDELVSRSVLPTSIMPEGLVSKLTDVEVRDLFAFLRSVSAGAAPGY